ncbi:MAG: class I SAM-dependent methyltransferase [Magnetovibrionaceae bacterium]
MTDNPFYASYHKFKGYEPPHLSKKQRRRFDADVWGPGGFRVDGPVLEIGCGEGLFLKYIKEKGVASYKGLDLDPALEAIIPDDIKTSFEVIDIWKFFDQNEAQSFHRIVMFDVLEHFTPEDGLNLLLGCKARLTSDGAILVKVPNAGSPWGLSYQFGDLTHLTPYTPSALRQLAAAADMTVEACWPHAEGSPNRRRLDRLVCGLLSKTLATPPEIWTGNFFGLLKPLDTEQPG